MLNLSMYPRCASYLRAMRVKPEEQGMTEYFAAVCIAESFPESALKKFGGINFHSMKGPQLIARMEQYLEYRSKSERKPSKKVKRSPLEKITAAVSDEEIEAAMTPKGGWKAVTLAGWGISWPPPTGWRRRLVDNYLAGKAQ